VSLAGFEEIEEQAGGDGENAAAIPDREHLTHQRQTANRQRMKLASPYLLLDGMSGQHGHAQTLENGFLDGLVAA
jgi:hypothetical protein